MGENEYIAGTTYSVRCTAKETRYFDGKIATKAGEVFWPIRTEWGPTGDDRMGPDLITFQTAAAAEEFAKNWKGHPWWYVVADAEVVLVARVERMVPQFVRYQVACPDSDAGAKTP